MPGHGRGDHVERRRSCTSRREIRRRPVVLEVLEQRLVGCQRPGPQPLAHRLLLVGERRRRRAPTRAPICLRPRRSARWLRRGRRRSPSAAVTVVLPTPPLPATMTTREAEQNCSTFMVESAGPRSDPRRSCVRARSSGNRRRRGAARGGVRRRSSCSVGRRGRRAATGRPATRHARGERARRHHRRRRSRASSTRRSPRSCPPLHRRRERRARRRWCSSSSTPSGALDDRRRRARAAHPAVARAGRGVGRPVGRAGRAAARRCSPRRPRCSSSRRGRASGPALPVRLDQPHAVTTVPSPDQLRRLAAPPGPRRRPRRDARHDRASAPPRPAPPGSRTGCQPTIGEVIVTLDGETVPTAAGPVHLSTARVVGTGRGRRRQPNQEVVFARLGLGAARPAHAAQPPCRLPAARRRARAHRVRVLRRERRLRRRRRARSPSSAPATAFSHLPVSWWAAALHRRGDRRVLGRRAGGRPRRSGPSSAPWRCSSARSPSTAGRAALQVPWWELAPRAWPPPSSSLSGPCPRSCAPASRRPTIGREGARRRAGRGRGRRRPRRRRRDPGQPLAGPHQPGDARSPPAPASGSSPSRAWSWRWSPRRAARRTHRDRARSRRGRRRPRRAPRPDPG